MRVQELRGVVRKDTPIAYRKTFTAEALLTFGDDEPKGHRIEFVVEMAPLGDTSVRVKFLNDPDYPLLPAVSALQEHIAELDRCGKLP